MVVRSLSGSVDTPEYEFVPVYFPTSAAKGLNEGIQKASFDFLLCCHQDVSFPVLLWTDRLKKVWELLHQGFGVVGTFGKEKNGRGVGYIFNPFPKVLKAEKHSAEVLSLDEHCLMFLRSSGLCFDESNPSFHTYGADLCMQSVQKGLRNYCIHSGGLNHLSGGKRDDAFPKSVEWFVQKWKKKTQIKQFISMCFEANLETGSWHSCI